MRNGYTLLPASEQSARIGVRFGLRRSPRARNSIMSCPEGLNFLVMGPNKSGPQQPLPVDPRLSGTQETTSGSRSDVATVGETHPLRNEYLNHAPADLVATARPANEQEHLDGRRPEMRVLIVSGVRLLRDGLAVLLAGRLRATAIQLAGSSDDAIALLQTFRPTLVLLDVSGPDGVAAATRIAPHASGGQVIAFAGGDADHDVIAYASAGVAAFISRDASTDELLAAVDRAARGELLCSPRVAGTMFRNLAALVADARARPAGAEASLTGREREIVRWIDEGMSNKEIARLLRIGVSTVKNHVHNILEKLGVSRRSEAAARLRGVDLDRTTIRPELETEI